MQNALTCTCPTSSGIYYYDRVSNLGGGVVPDLDGGTRRITAVVS